VARYTGLAQNGASTASYAYQIGLSGDPENVVWTKTSAGDPRWSGRRGGHVASITGRASSAPKDGSSHPVDETPTTASLSRAVRAVLPRGGHRRPGLGSAAPQPSLTPTRGAGPC
jgi:hypothetical protein